MDKTAAEKKMESLMKYVPFIDFVLKVDHKKYIKFINIKKWIILRKKKYPLTDINKIEQSIITQYKNLLIENNVQIPEKIVNIFSPMNLNQFVNLCSDEEDDDAQKYNKSYKKERNSNTKNKTKAYEEKPSHSKKCQNQKTPTKEDSSDDDLEIVSFNYPDNLKKGKAVTQLSRKTNLNQVDAEEEGLYQSSKDMFIKIDKYAKDDLKMKSSVHEPINYSYQKEEHNELEDGDVDFFQRRKPSSDVLFKRRADFNDDKEQSLENNIVYSKKIETICLDSDNDDELPTTSSKVAVVDKPLNVETTLAEKRKSGEQTNSADDNSNRTNKIYDKVDQICKTIDSVFLDTDIMNDLEITNDSLSNINGNQATKACIEKENVVKTSSENNISTPILNPQQVSKILEDISNRTDFEMETLFEAIAVVTQNNNSSAKTTEVAHNFDQAIPVEAPPLAPSSPVQYFHQQQPTVPYHVETPAVYYPPQQHEQSQMTPALTPQYRQNSNFATGTVGAPPKPKVNVNDPRIIKQLHSLQNSPLFQLNVLNPEIEASIRKICEATKYQQNPKQQQTPSTCSTKPKTYGEYLKKKLEIEKQRDEERKAKAKKQMEIEKSELLKNKLVSPLNPCKEKLKSKQKNLAGTSAMNKPTNTETEILSRTRSPQTTQGKSTVKENKAKENKKTNKKSKNKTDNQNYKTNNADQKLNRVYKELECSLKGFDRISDYIPDACEKSFESDTRSTIASKEVSMPRPIGLRRRSSMHALSAISEQLRQQSSDCSDTELNQKRYTKRLSTDAFTNSSSENLSQDSISIPKRRKTIDENIRPTKRSNTLRILDDDRSSLDSFPSSPCWNISNISEDKLKPKELVIKLHRLRPQFINEQTKRQREETEATNLEDNQIWRIKKNCEIVANPKVPALKMTKLTKYNNDCQMTERNTSICVICRSKPSDLTNHYVGKHKTESYIARLEWSELDDLSINTPFAKLLPKTKNFRFERYEVDCPFCKDKVVDHFFNFYNHYSTHTGEYAYQCSHCRLTKPYKPDIQSHILHAKACRNSSIQVMYRYHPNTRCIYLHYCKICNFVQLNEANVLKHLREHHDHTKAVTSNVQKCILTAINDGPDANEESRSPLPMLEKCFDDNNTVFSGQKEQTETSKIEFKVDDDNIPVSNEPCIEDEFLQDEKYSLEQQFKKMHEDPSVTSKITHESSPMTVIHYMENNLNSAPISSLIQPSKNASLEIRHLPIVIKTEPKEIERSPSSSNNKPIEKELQNKPLVPYKKYRSYPQNVNYLGLYKCMIDDCYYSTDCSEEINKHFTEHSEETKKALDYLQCPYCIIQMNTQMTSAQLIEHMRSQHSHLIYQCSMCCYRSCDASNVRIHQQIHHNNYLNSCQIYKCSKEGLNFNSNQVLNLNKQVEANISRIICKCCDAGFYNTKLLINHLINAHMQSNVSNLNKYSCIYCPLSVENINDIRVHMAKKHPGELPRAYDHNTEFNIMNEDNISISNVIDISETVAWVDISASVEKSTESEDLFQEVKPNLTELMQISEETIKVRLVKLTANTGVAPDNLYRCPEATCGGFHSNFDLWLKHMKMRHHTLECQCPHCPETNVFTLKEISLHFEQHRRHTFICFYCSTTSPNEILAKQHAVQEHNDLGSMRIEKIRYNISYYYSIMLQSDLFKERENFISEFLTILDKRLKDLEIVEIQTLKTQWPVRDDTPWIDEFLQILSNRKVARPCLIKDCNFRTRREDFLYRHLSTSHTINGTQFNCSKCDYHVEKCNNLDELFDHIKLHNEYIFICGACSVVTSSHSKMSSHIEEQHTARDVPVVHLFKTDQQLFIKIYIVFADNYLTFSTMKNCFCCGGKNMDGDVLNLHLKRYHKLSLDYFCEKCTNFNFKSLKEVKPHFVEFHRSEKFKISCKLAGHNELSVTSLTDFQVEIRPVVPIQATMGSIQIKNEPLDMSNSDNVILLEDDDIVIQNSLREEQAKQAQSIPKIKCASLSKLIQPTENASLIRPTSSPTTTLYHTHFPTINPDYRPSASVAPNSSLVVPPTSSLPTTLYPAHFSAINLDYQPSAAVAPNSSLAVPSADVASNFNINYHHNTFINNSNMTINVSCPLNSTPVPSAETNMFYHSNFVSSNFSNNISTKIGLSVPTTMLQRQQQQQQIESVAPHPHNGANTGSYIQPVPNNVYTDHIGSVQTPQQHQQIYSKNNAHT